MSDDEMAKLHVRHMVGGTATNFRDERSAASSFPNGPARCWNS